MFTLKFDTDNSAFDDAPREEIARILKEAAEKVIYGENDGKILDENGNTIGKWKWVF